MGVLTPPQRKPGVLPLSPQDIERMTHGVPEGPMTSASDVGRGLYAMGRDMYQTTRKATDPTYIDPDTLDGQHQPYDHRNAFDLASMLTLGAGAMPTRGATLRAGMGRAKAAAKGPVSQRGDEILDMLKSGRGSDVTDAMLDMGDPVQTTRLNAYLYDNYDLPMDEASRKYRADAEMGLPVHKKFRGEYYHETPADIDAFKLYADPNSHTGGGAIWVSETPHDIPAAHHTRRRTYDEGKRFLDGVNTMPVVVRDDAPLPGAQRYNMRMEDKLPPSFPAVVDMPTNEALRASGYTHIDQGIERVVLDPRNIRSRFARFDPRLKHLTNLSAGVLPPLAAGIMGMSGGEAEASPTADAIREYIKRKGK